MSLPEVVAVLTSGGVDSAILAADLASHCRRVHPLYVRAGLSWEEVELDHLRHFLAEVKAPALTPLTVLEMPVRDLYGGHWSLTGRGVPDAESEDQAVYLPGRNLLLLLKAMLWCHLHGVPAVALAILKSNPFPDASERFFDQFAAAVNEGVQGRVSILRPYAHLTKTEVLRIGREFPLRWSFSCIQPVGGVHCGRCNKCAERLRGFREAGMLDPTEYAS